MYSLALTPGRPSASTVRSAVAISLSLAVPLPAAQQRRRAVALLAPLVPEAVDHGEHVVEADRLAPGHRSARVVEAEREPGVHVVGGADALADREGRLVHELADDPAEHEARARRPPTRRASPSAREERLGRLGGDASACVGSRVSSTRRTCSSGGRRWKPTAPGSPARGEASGRRRARAAARRPGSSGSAGAAPGVDHQLGAVPPSRSVEAGGARRARAGRAPAGRRRRSTRPCPRRRRARAARDRPAGTARPRRTRSSRARSCGPSRPAATIRAWIGLGFQRGSPNDSSVNDLRHLEAHVDPDQVHQLERAHPEAAAEPADAVDLLVAWPPAPGAAAAPRRRTGARSGSRGSRGRRPRGSRACPSPRRPRGPAPARARPVWSARDHLQQLHQRRRVEEVHARPRSRAAPRRRPATVTGIDEVFVASTASSAADLRQRARTARA